MCHWFDTITFSFLLYFHVVCTYPGLVLFCGVLKVCSMLAGLARMPLESSTTAEQTGRGVALVLEGILFNSDW